MASYWRQYSTAHSEDRDASLGERASKTRSRYAKNSKKRKEAAGRAFKDVEGYGDMLHGVDAGLSPARAMRKAAKLQPKQFSGRVAMYFANSSNKPDPVITEENLESMPSPNSIRTVKAVKVDNDTLSTESTDPLIDFVSDKQSHMSPVQLQRTVQQMQAKNQSFPILQRKSRPPSTQAQPQSQDHLTSHSEAEARASPKESLNLQREEEDVLEDEIEDFEEDDDVWNGEDEELDEGDEGDLTPRRMRPDSEEDLGAMSTATREAIEKVRHLFQGTLSWYQPQDGEMSAYVAQQQEAKKSIPSQRAALTSANATSVRTILGGTKSADSHIVGLSDAERAAIVGEKQKAPKAIRAVQPKAFFDYTQIQLLASRDYERAKRAGQKLDTPLKNVSKLPQICVVGRSNVGKSSLLNAVMGPKFKSLRVSKTPGRTQTVQMLVVSEKLVVTDTPGYGYAAATPKARKEMEHRIGEYLASRLPRRVYILIDARRGLGNADLRLADSLEQLHIVYQIVLTKCDKKQSAEQQALIERNIQQWVSRRGCAMNEVIKTSARERSGIDQLRLSIYLAGGFKL